MQQRTFCEELFGAKNYFVSLVWFAYFFFLSFWPSRKFQIRFKCCKKSWATKRKIQDIKCYGVVKNQKIQNLFCHTTIFLQIFVRLGMGEQTNKKKNWNPSLGTMSKIGLHYTREILKKYKGKLRESVNHKSFNTNIIFFKKKYFINILDTDFWDEFVHLNALSVSLTLAPFCKIKLGFGYNQNKPKFWSVQLEKTLNLSIKFSVPLWKILGSKKEIWVQKNFWVQKKFWVPKKFLDPKKFLGPKKFWVPKNFWVQKNCGSKKILVQKNCGFKKIWVCKIFWVKNFWSPLPTA